MGVTKISQKGHEYYTRSLAAEENDYWLEEEPGRWLGKGAAALGLEGVVTAEQLENLFGRGRHPDSGVPLGVAYPPEERRKVVSGIALTFSPPKSVSTLWAAGDGLVASNVEAAQRAAVDAAMDYLGTHAAFTRRGHNGVLQVDTHGLIATAFDHRTSRTSDPQLHTHVLVANKVRAASDGKWLSLDGREVYAVQKAAGMIYKAALRSELTLSMHVSWTAVDANGIAEIQGVPRGLAGHWSSRSMAVKARTAVLVAEREATLGRTLTPGERVEAAEMATLQTRPTKRDADTATVELRSRWQAEARSLGMEFGRWRDDVFGFQRRPSLSPAQVEKRALALLAEGPATFGRAQVSEAVAAALVPSGVGAKETLAEIEGLTDRVLAHPEVLALTPIRLLDPPHAALRSDGLMASERHGVALYATSAVLRAEAVVLDAATAIDRRVPRPRPGEVDLALTRCPLGSDQAKAVRRVALDPAAISVVVGAAGVGKSRLLRGMRSVYEGAGTPVVGFAPSAMAASVLTEESGIRADTLASFAFGARFGKSQVQPGSVVVIDEAGMARTDELAVVIDAARSAGAKVVLVGDPAQLGPVGPGGLFRLLVADRGIEVGTVRRFAAPWEANASLALRARDPAVLSTYARHGRISGGEREKVLDSAFEAWSDHRGAGRSVVMCASDHATVDELALRARAARVSAGQVEPTGVALGNQRVGVGDEVVTLRNDRRLVSSTGGWVRNGGRWVVEGREGKVLTLRSVGDDGQVRVPAHYATEHVALAYALTVHKAQGVTTDASIVIVDPSMSAAQLYVGMTRGRLDNRALAITDGSEWDHRRVSAPSPEEVLARVLRRDGLDLSAHEALRMAYVDEPNRMALAAMLAEARAHIDRHAGPDRTREIAELQPRADLHAAHWALRDTERALSVATHGRQRAALAVEDAAQVRSRRAGLPGALGSGARRELEEARRAAARSLSGARQEEASARQRYDRARHRVHAAEVADQRLGELRQAQTAREAWLARHPAERDWVAQLGAALHTRHIEAPSLDRRLSRQAGRNQDLGRDRSAQRTRRLDPLGAETSAERILRQLEANRQRELERHLRGPQRGRGIGGPSLGL